MTETVAELQQEIARLEAQVDALSSELAETNQGVLALYAELDDNAHRLRDASDLKSRFLSYMSHEFRTPLSSILSITRILQDRLDGPLTDEQQKQVHFIQAAAGELTEMVNDLLDLAKAEAGRMEPNLSDVDLKAVFGQLRGTLRPLATRPEVDFIVEEPAVPRLRSDEVLLAQVLRNLLTNAIKFTAQGSIRLAVAQVGGDVRFTVADTGAGIPAELHERVFEEFYQVPGSYALSGKGTGLGLPYARRLVSILGGALHVSSTPGEGSTFTVSLPVSQ